MYCLQTQILTIAVIAKNLGQRFSCLKNSILIYFNLKHLTNILRTLQNQPVNPKYPKNSSKTQNQTKLVLTS
jgi:hypothetical protein